MEASYRAIVKKCELEKDKSNVFLLEFELAEGTNFFAGPGQFIILEPKNNCSVMPRPFSIVEVEGNVVSVLIKVVGNNTKAYSELKLNDEIKISGPQGAIIPINPKTKKYILVGGGIGGVALIMFAKKLRDQEKDFIVLLGAKDKSQISGLDFFEKYGIKTQNITEIGDELNGFVTDLLAENIDEDGGVSTVIACGPKPMLKKVAEVCEKSGNQCLVILEEVMACGMGSCKGCVIVGKDETIKHICTDGPVINAEWIDWKKFIPSLTIELSERKSLHENSMKVELGDLKLDFPTMNASGCLSVEALEKGYFDFSELGALVTKGVTVMEKLGNIMPRTCETPSGMINSIGLENVGSKVFFQNELPRWLALGKPVFVNISGFSIEDYVELAQAVDKTDAIGMEVNISCPNIKDGGITFGVDPKLAFEVTQAVRRVTDKFVIVKLTPNVTDIVSIAKACVKAGANAISLINTVQAMSIDPFTRRSKIGTIMGGLSGPAIRPIAIRMVHQLYKANLGVPIIGMGGIEDGKSAAEFFMAGATMIAVGTGGFSNRKVFNEINNGLKELINFHGFSSIKEMVGSMLK